VTESSSVRWLQELYAVVVGLGLALAAEQVVDLDRAIPVRWEVVPLFIAYLSIALPYSHAGVRYLDSTYADERAVSRPRVMADIFFGAGNFIWMIALALFVSRPFVFGWALVIWLLGVLARSLILRLLPRGERSAMERTTDPMNVGLVIAVVLVLVGSPLFGVEAEVMFARAGLLITGIGYAGVMYGLGFGYFFPSSSEPDQVP
jgi:hypothetical protein